MAEKVIRVDDLDGSEGADVVRREFSVVDRTFSIDLSDDNDKRLRELLDGLADYIEHATEVKQAGRARKRSDATSRLANGHTNTDVRAWAKDNDIEVSARGSIDSEVYDLYHDAFPDSKPEE
ncbi:Lsr2 family protein [Microtetraspora sp. NBRC 13810]|uniref:histone-like nucleoid-structuring protein Lsr2 n=1 Tax=Microtetraspora sp. NBRC 13810 TaxID=3030990 RepID=UPI0024A08262|nr:Lsr2 family protein [Microtetraspora sp. NBRC 13810]GLW09102.1 Lsr2 family protein [Microtetraspora sp. NBRC 13810]